MKAFPDHFSAVADDYHRYRPRYPQALLDYLATLAPARGPVWDCAAGSGQLTALLARHFDTVIASDASLQQLRAFPPGHPGRWVCRAEAPGLRDRSVALITVAQAAHWFDFDAFYASAGRVLVPGGHLLLLSYGLFQSTPALDALIAAFYDGPLAPHWPEERHWIDEAYQTLPFPFQERTVPSLFMQQHWSMEQLLGYLRTWSAVQRFLADDKDNRAVVGAFEQSLSRAWPAQQSELIIRWPLHLRVGVNT